jgi:hypothetical protein
MRELVSTEHARLSVSYRGGETFCHEQKRDLDALVEAGHSNLSVTHLAVRETPGSGSGKELLAWAGIDADHIATAARRLVGK